MVSVICPYCGKIKCIIFEDAMHELMTNGAADVKCDYCKMEFHVYNGKEKIESKK